MDRKNGSNGSEGIGNSISIPPRINAALRWSFTWWYDEDDLAPAIEVFEKLGKFIFGYEIAPTSGKKHVQGYIEFTKKTRPNELKALKAIGITGEGKDANIRWFKCKGSREDNIEYCTKSESKDPNKTTYFSGLKLPRKVVDPLEGKTLRKIQKRVLEEIKKEPDDRTITWIVDTKGAAGKTTLCKSICLRYPEETIYVQGKANDIKYALTEFLKNKDNDLRIVLFDFVRSNEDFVSYDAIESVKNGIFFNGKYESGMAVFNSPHVYVLANFAPDKEKLSMDRWNIINLDE